MNTAVIWVNLAGAVFACAVNAVAAVGGLAPWRPLRAAVALLAAVYASSYVALLAGLWQTDAWSETMRGVSPVAWLVVWSGPPIQSALWWRRTVAHARTIIERDRRPEGLNHGS